jgi:KDO2-lipid IV(A) lauroyltransferase
MSRILYYFVLLPLSWLPLWILYGISEILYLVFLTIWPYRKKIIETNLKHSFPKLTDKELKYIRNDFYRHLSDLIAEGIKNLGMSEKELLTRVHVNNPELMEELAMKKKNILLIGGHFGNWEWVITSQALLFKQHALGLGKPLTNRFLNQKINSLRGRFGMDIVHAKNYKEFIEKSYPNGFAMLTLSDQSPGDSLKSYWTFFLNQQTAVLYGSEQMAHNHDLAVVFFSMEKLKRGSYELHLELICESPNKTQYGEITEKHTQLLQRQILKNPACWLWSHKRWKREVPEDVASLMLKRKIEFDSKRI